ncbi:sodium:calcium antiporter [Halopenitus persicus]|uniref:Cation:H+ antiporter n=1 Tax=Halopenitus persicus TaxID=1048396 RepID=A0A1H3FKC3_9EURY|nr:sodium:calcium antiporter [Halopenitus persicus]SDX91380.1 cation:H+ antiporter [Halopenitus persicus]
MLSTVLLLLLGLAALIYGGETVVDGASGLAHGLGVTRLFVGVTVVAVGTSLPEIATAVYSGIYGAPEFLVGHIVGSATSQITVGVGIVALVSPLVLDRAKLRLYGGGMLVGMTLMVAVIRSGRATRPEGAVLVGSYVLFLALTYQEMELHESAARRVRADASVARTVARLGGGLALLVVGGHFLIVNGREVAVALGVPQLLIGLLTGLGTTLPEIAVAALAVSKDRHGIAVGTLFGSNVTDPLFSFGIGVLVSGFTFADVDFVLGSALYMLVVSTLVVGVFFVRSEVGRAEAAACIALYLPTFLV